MSEKNEYHRMLTELHDKTVKGFQLVLQDICKEQNDRMGSVGQHMACMAAARAAAELVTVCFANAAVCQALRFNPEARKCDPLKLETYRTPMRLTMESITFEKLAEKAQWVFDQVWIEKEAPTQ